MSNENNSEQEEKKESLITKGWNDFILSIKGGYSKLQQSLEEQGKKNQEKWEENKEKAANFFKKAKENWDKQFKKWDEDVKKAQAENKEKWDARKQKIQKDIEDWQEKTRQDWKDGIKEWNRMSTKAYIRFLCYTIPILIIIIIVLRLIMPYLE